MIVGVSCDSQQANKAFKEKFDFPFDLLCDESGTMSATYGALAPGKRGFPSRISYWIGPKGTVVKAYPEVSPGSHASDVLEDLNA